MDCRHPLNYACISRVITNQTTPFLSGLSPLVSLLGQSPTHQYLSQYSGLLDCPLFGLGPLGIFAAITAVIRLKGPRWLKSIIGYGMESETTKEKELMSSTSSLIGEYWDGEKVIRDIEAPIVKELIYTPNEAKVQLSSDAKKDPNYLKGRPEDLEGAETDYPPNLLLNLGIFERQRCVSFYVIVGMILQSAVIIPSLAIMLVPESGMADAFQIKVVNCYLTFLGTIFLALSMGACAWIVGGSSRLQRWTPQTDQTYIIWLQRSSARDANGDSFILADPLNNQLLSCHRTERKRTRLYEKYLGGTLLPGLTIGAYIAQFIGLYFMPGIIQLGQFLTVIFMHIARMIVCRQQPPLVSLRIQPDHELDFLALAMAYQTERKASKEKPTKKQIKGLMKPLSLVFLPARGIFKFQTGCLGFAQPYDPGYVDWLTKASSTTEDKELGEIPEKENGSMPDWLPSWMVSSPRIRGGIVEGNEWWEPISASSEDPAIPYSDRDVNTNIAPTILKNRTNLIDVCHWTGAATDIARSLVEAIKCVRKFCKKSLKYDQPLNWTIDIKCADEDSSKYRLLDQADDLIRDIEAVLSLWLFNAKRNAMRHPEKPDQPAMSNVYLLTHFISYSNCQSFGGTLEKLTDKKGQLLQSDQYPISQYRPVSEILRPQYDGAEQATGATASGVGLLPFNKSEYGPGRSKSVVLKTEMDYAQLYAYDIFLSFIMSIVLNVSNVSPVLPDDFNELVDDLGVLLSGEFSNIRWALVPILTVISDHGDGGERKHDGKNPRHGGSYGRDISTSKWRIGEDLQSASGLHRRGSKQAYTDD